MSLWNIISKSVPVNLGRLYTSGAWLCNFKAPTHFYYAGVFLKVCPLIQIVNDTNTVKGWQVDVAWCLKTLYYQW